MVKKGGAGSIVTDSGGIVELKEGSTHFLKRGEVERMVREGVVEEVQAGIEG